MKSSRDEKPGGVQLRAPHPSCRPGMSKDSQMKRSRRSKLGAGRSEMPTSSSSSLATLIWIYMGSGSKEPRSKEARSLIPLSVKTMHYARNVIHINYKCELCHI